MKGCSQFCNDTLSRDDYQVTFRVKYKENEDSVVSSGVLLEKVEKDDSPLLPKDKEHSRRISSFIIPYRNHNFGVSISYFNTGIAIFLLMTPVTYYLVDTLDVDATQLSAFITLVYLPWSMKFIFGLITDCFSIFGYRRKSWMIIGWFTYILFNFILCFFSEPSLIFVTTLMFISTCGYLFADVCNDAQSIERSKFECIELKGAFQTSMYAIRSVGMSIGAIQSGILYNTSIWGWGLTLSQLFILAAMIPLTTVVPYAYFIEEIKSKEEIPTVTYTFWNVWKVFQMKAVWSPMIFYIPYYCLQLSNAAWTNFLIAGK
jgi:hypothetical protein